MKRFSDLGVKVENERNIFSVVPISIEELINKEIEVLDFQSGIKTRHGEDRVVVKIKVDNAERKFFTSAKPIKDALMKINKNDFPFVATIKIERFGGNSGKTYFFT